MKSLYLITRLWPLLKALIRMFRARLRGDYKQLSAKTVILVALGIGYVLLPFDLVGDFIPGLGQLDDVAVIGLIVAALESEIQQFIRWESEQNLPSR